MRTVRTVAELRAALAPARRDRRGASASSRPWARFHEGHLSLIRARPRGVRRRRRLAVRQPGPVRRPPRTSTPTRATRPPTRPAPRSGRRPALRARPPRRSTRRASPPRSACAALTEPLEGASRGAEHFHGVTTVVAKLPEHGRSPTSPTSARRTPSRSPSCGGWSRDLDLPVADRRPAHGARARRPGACPAATPTSTPPSASAPSRSPRALRGRQARPPAPARATPATSLAAARAAMEPLRRRARVRRARRPRHARAAGATRRARRCSPSPRASAPCGSSTTR